MTSPVPAGMVRIFPMPGVSLPDGVALKVQDVDPATAEALTAPISRHDDARRFVSDPALLPDGWAPPDPDHLTTDSPSAAPIPAAPSRRPSTKKQADAAETQED